MRGVRDIVEKYTFIGAKCQCPCGAGITAATELDYIVPCSISNWGAYGIEDSLALLLDNEDVMHGSELEDRILNTNAYQEVFLTQLSSVYLWWILYQLNTIECL